MPEDLVHGLRMLRKNPGFAAGAVLLIALGVGANSAVFTVARLVFRPMPVGNPDGLVSIWRESLQTRTAFGSSWPHLADWNTRKQIFEGVAAYASSGDYASSAAAGFESGPVTYIQVTESFFPMLRVRPVQGRPFSKHDLLPASSDAALVPVIVSDDFCRRRFGRANGVMGAIVRIGASKHMIAGVLPRGFRMFRNDTPEVFAPLRPFPGHLEDRSMTYLDIVARLRPGTKLEQARAEMAAYSRRARAEHPQTDGLFVCRVGKLSDRLFGPMRPRMVLLLGSTGLVLLIACANLATLLLVRGNARQREIAIRTALGAGRLRITRQLLAESLTLAVLGGAAGFLLASWGADLFNLFSRSAGLGLAPIQIDGAVIAFTLFASLATGGLFGIVPALQTSKVDVQSMLKAGSPGCSTAFRCHGWGGTMVITEIAISMVLLTGAGLLARSFVRMNAANPGFRSDHVLAMSVGTAPYSADFRSRERLFWSQLAARASSLPGTEAAAFSGSVPLGAQQAPENMKARVRPERAALQDAGFLMAEYRDVSAGFFRAMGIPLKRGRTFQSAAEDASAVIINESFAREAWGGEDPVGRRIYIPGGRPYIIIGVAGDVKQYSLRAAGGERVIYRPLWESDLAALSKWPSQYLVVRTKQEPGAMAAALKAIAASIDRERPIVFARTMDDVVAKSTAWDSLITSVAGMFGLTALLLTVVGMYAVISHSVARRRREIGIRVALGGRAEDIRRLVLRQAGTLVVAGIAAGTLPAILLNRLIASQLFDAGILDAFTLAAASLLLGTVALLTCYAPVRRATRMEPLSVLRAE